MSLDSEKLNEILETLKTILAEIQKTSNSLDLLTDNIADNHKELLEKIHAVEAYQKNILEPNQKTIFEKVKAITGEETEQPQEPTET